MNITLYLVLKILHFVYVFVINRFFLSDECYVLNVNKNITFDVRFVSHRHLPFYAESEPGSGLCAQPRCGDPDALWGGDPGCHCFL